MQHTVKQNPVHYCDFRAIGTSRECTRCNERMAYIYSEVTVDLITVWEARHVYTCWRHGKEPHVLAWVERRDRVQRSCGAQRRTG